MMGQSEHVQSDESDCTFELVIHPSAAETQHERSEMKRSHNATQTHANQLQSAKALRC